MSTPESNPLIHGIDEAFNHAYEKLRFAAPKMLGFHLDNLHDQVIALVQHSCQPSGGESA